MGKLIGEIEKAFAGLPKLKKVCSKINKKLLSPEWKGMKKEIIGLQKR